MDLNKFDSRAAAEHGSDLQLLHSVTGEPLEDNGLPVLVTVMGTEGRGAQAALRDINRAKMRAKNKSVKDDPSEQSLEDLHQALAIAAAPLILGFKNVTRGDRLAVAPGDVDWFLNLQLINGQEGEVSFLEQVSQFATKRANFLGNALKG